MTQAFGEFFEKHVATNDLTPLATVWLRDDCSMM